MPEVIFVCTANRYRSPLAAAMFQKCLQREADGIEWKVSSAGVWTDSGQPALPAAVQIARKMGFSLRSHRSRLVDPKLLSQASLIIVMEGGQREALLVEFPHLEKRVFLLSEVATGIAYDIPDLFDEIGHLAPELGEEVCGLVEQGYQEICRLALQHSVDMQLMK